MYYFLPTCVNTSEVYHYSHMYVLHILTILPVYWGSNILSYVLNKVYKTVFFLCPFWFSEPTPLLPTYTYLVTISILGWLALPPLHTCIWPGREAITCCSKSVHQQIHSFDLGMLAGCLVPFGLQNNPVQLPAFLAQLIFWQQNFSCGAGFLKPTVHETSCWFPWLNSERGSLVKPSLKPCCNV